MKLSILISTKNRKEILRQTLQTVFYKQNLPIDDFEVIVTNDGDQQIDDLKNEFAFPNLTIIKNLHKAGLSGGRNNGAENARGEIIIFFDDDILVSPDFFVRMLTIHEKYDEIILGGNRIYPEDLIQKANAYPFGRYKLKHEYQWLDAQNLKPLQDSLFESNGLAGFSASMKLSTYKKIGSFNENFEYAGCEDSEFFYRAEKIGIKLIFDESNICYHNEFDNFELKAWLKRQSTGIRSAVVMCMLHPEGKNHPTWYTNTPVSNKDKPWVKRLKRKKRLLSRTWVMHLFFDMVWLSEKIHMPDKILFKLYNALWLGSTYKSFRKAYEELISKN